LAVTRARAKRLVPDRNSDVRAPVVSPSAIRNRDEDQDESTGHAREEQEAAPDPPICYLIQVTGEPDTDGREWSAEDEALHAFSLSAFIIVVCGRGNSTGFILSENPFCTRTGGTVLIRSAILLRSPCLR